MLQRVDVPCREVSLQHTLLRAKITYHPRKPRQPWPESFPPYPAARYARPAAM